MTPRKTRIAVLGGGFGSLAAVFAITSQPGWEDRYSITVYQIGWRLGGKAASGRDADAHERSAERGGHILFGFYDNALAMLRRCYQELGRTPGAPMATFKEAFHPADTLYLRSDVPGRSPVWPLTLPRNDAQPGACAPLPTTWGYVGLLLAWLVESIPQLHERFPSFSEILAVAEPSARDLVHAQIDRARKLGVPSYAAEPRRDGGAVDYDAILQAAAAAEVDWGDEADHRLLRAWALPLLSAAELGLAAIAAAPEGLRFPHFLGPLRLAFAVARGILEDRLYAGTRGFDAIGNEEFRGWLARHGAAKDLVDHPLVLGLYDAFHAYEGGDRQKPSIAASAMVRLLLRLFFTYRGALYYAPQAGMGETVFAPLYQLLRRRGVRFRFFHKVKHLHLSRGGDSVAAITLGKQVELKRPNVRYEPLVAVKGLPCWPHQPRWHQIVLGDAPEIRAFDFESQDSPEVEEILLRRGRDFDQVILGIPPAALRKIAADLARKSPRWQSMLDNLASVAVGGAQLWLHPSWSQLVGQPGDPEAGANFPAPFPRWVNTSSRIPTEAWRGNFWPGASIALDGAIPDAVVDALPADPRERELALRTWLKAQAAKWLGANTRALWPDGTAGFTSGLDWNLLVDPERRMAEGRLDTQHFWASIAGSGRHVLSLPRADCHRLRVDGTGLRNLFLAGDWVDSGLNLGCIESAVVSGLQVARSIAGYPVLIVGEHERADAPLEETRIAAAPMARDDATLKLAVSH